MKIFQILNNLTHAEFSYLGSIQEIPEGTFPQELMDQLIETPDEVFSGWGYINGELIKPTPPEGFEYHEETGTFYSIDESWLSQNQHNTFGKTHEAVDSGVITEETFKQITGEDYIPHNIEEV